MAIPLSGREAKAAGFGVSDALYAEEYVVQSRCAGVMPNHRIIEARTKKRTFQFYCRLCAVPWSLSVSLVHFEIQPGRVGFCAHLGGSPPILGGARRSLFRIDSHQNARKTILFGMPTELAQQSGFLGLIRDTSVHARHITCT